MEIRDRRAGFLWINNEIIDEYAAKVGGTALLVYVMLCRYADNKTAEAHPSQERLATLCGFTDRTIRTALSALEENGLVSVERTVSHGRRDRNIYTLLSVGDRKDTSYRESPRPEVTTGSATGSPLPINNTEQDLEQDLNLCPPDAKPSKKKNSTDPRYQQFTEVLSNGYKRKGWEFCFNGKDGKQLKALLKDRPKWDVLTFQKCLRNYFASDKVVQGDMPYVYLSRLPRYQNGPLNEFGKMLKSEVSYAGDTTHYA